MKCLQCGTELDRLSKWRGSSEYCSEECKKDSQEEFNRLAMNRLMQPRAARTTARVAANAVRTVESATGRLTVVTHPVGASSPVITEPPEADFINSVAAVLADLQLCQQPPAPPRPLLPLIPSSELGTGSALVALEAILRGIRPAMRGRRKLTQIWDRALAHVAVEKIELVLPVAPLEWPESLGIPFSVAGLDNLPATVAAGVAIHSPQGAPSEPASLPMAGLPANLIVGPIASRNVPPRRPKRDLTTLFATTVGSDYLLQSPSVSAPRLRIHLPKPVLTPFRPRYAFAPKETSVPAPVKVETPAPQVTPQPEPEAESKAKPKVQNAKGARRQENKADEKPALSTASKPQTALEPKAVPAPVEQAKVQRAASEPAPVEKAKKEKTERPATEPVPLRKETEKPSNPPEPRGTETFSAPTFGGKAEAEPEGFFARMPGWLKATAALVVIGVAVGAWALPALNRGSSRGSVQAAGPAAPSVMGADSWETDSSGDTAGIARHRVVSLYKPARTKRNYIFEFTGQIEQRAMGWVFRMKDPRNYYCLKLEQTGEGAKATFQLVKFAVVDGEEQPHRLVSLRDPLTAGQPVQVRLDVRGQNFATQVNGRPVDVWIDNQISEGTVGFSNESGERAVIRTVKVSY